MIEKIVRALKERNLIRKTIGKCFENIVLFQLGNLDITLGQLIMKRGVFDNAVGAIKIYDFWRNEYLASELFDGYPLKDGYYDFISKDYIGKMDRIAIIGNLLKMTLHLSGNIAEFGVYKGHTAVMIKNLISRDNSKKTFYLFDSFKGLPDSYHEGDEFWKDKEYFKDSSPAKIIKLLDNYDNVKVVEGFFGDTLKKFEDVTYSFCHVDVAYISIC